MLLGNLDESGERGGVGDGQFGEDLAVDLDTGGLEALDEPVVGDAALAGTAVPVSVVERVEHLLLGLAVQPRTLTPVTAGQFESCATLLLGVHRPLDACHGSILSISGGAWGAQGVFTKARGLGPGPDE